MNRCRSMALLGFAGCVTARAGLAFGRPVMGVDIRASVVGLRRFQLPAGAQTDLRLVVPKLVLGGLGSDGRLRRLLSPSAPRAPFGRQGGETDLTFVRHAETVANATGRYSAPTLNAFSEKGAREVANLTRELLAAPSYSRILVSPSPRALRTIAPYLAATHRRATVWPLLYECTTGKRPRGAHATSFKFGPKVVLPRDVAPLFVVDPTEDRLPVSPDYNSGLAQVAAAVREFRSRYSGARVLLVGHSGQGGHFLHELTGKWIKVENAKPLRLQVP